MYSGRVAAGAHEIFPESDQPPPGSRRPDPSLQQDPWERRAAARDLLETSLFDCPKLRRPPHLWRWRQNGLPEAEAEFPAANTLDMARSPLLRVLFSHITNLEF